MKQDKLFTKIFFYSIFTLCMFSTSFGQTHIGNVTLTTQTDVNNFGALNYSTIEGRLNIDGSFNGNINDLTPLTSITAITYDLRIYKNPLLTNLNGLNNIFTIGGSVDIINNNVLINIDGLENLTSIESELYVTNNPELTNLDGLSGVTSVGSALNINSNNKLSNINGLIGINSLGGSLDIEKNPVLVNIDGLNNITSVGGFLDIEDNLLITNLDGLSNITSVNGSLNIDGNLQLTNLDGLENIISVSSGLLVRNNSVLTSFCGLFNLLNGNGLGGAYNVGNNAVNPTIANIIAGGPCITVSVEEDFSLLSYFELNQNYPNPFNPSTTIKYTIPNVISTEGRNLNVQLKVYDVLGNEVITLVNEEKPAGSYEVDFDATGLSSGVYFYKLQSEKFVQTKKMILLR